MDVVYPDRGFLEYAVVNSDVVLWIIYLMLGSGILAMTFFTLWGMFQK